MINTDTWEQRKWMDTVDISTEMVDPTTGEYDDMPHIAPGNIESFTGRILDNVKTVKEEQLISGKFRFRPDDVVYGKINPQLGKYFYANVDGLTSADAYVFNGKNGITQKFLYSILQTNDFFKYSVSVSKRSGMPKINRDELNAYSFLVPNEEEQEKIGDFLIDIDHLITLHQRKLFLNFAKRNDWEQRKLVDVVDVRSGRDYKHLEEGDIPVYGTGGYMLSVNEALSDDEDAIGIGRKGTIDNPYILRAPFWTVDTLFYAVPRDKYDLNFVFDIFQNVNWKAKDESTGVPSLSKATINAVETLMPEYAEQKKIGEYFSYLDNFITLHRRAYYNKKGGLTNVHNDNQQHYAIL